MDFSKLFSLEGRVAVITGGSRGIGRMLAEGFLAAGCAKVYITARKAAVVEETARELGDRVIALPGDISTLAGIEALAEDLAKLEPKIDILVNNAGVAWGADFEDFPEGGWDKVMNLNVKTPFFLTQKLHGLLKAAASAGQPAKVINIASIDGMRVNPWETYSYQASKAAVIHLTRRMAARLIKDNIVVTCIAPGAYPSEMNKVAARKPEESARGIPSGRIGGVEDIAGGAIYLASRAGDYVVGTTIPIDGGIVNAWIPSDFVDPSGH
ncbi:MULTISPECIES: SDR family oxidoreductase [unclassified Novosphingobium]|jgi:NAD(P)-dependent dehydrogenase (short-subunit alcohol dehydrogenase family)|uniref:SDR family oxidoreductase n=1 Tax=unclassified Novosphingobium TaxID=2644732 RepID=UPI00061BCA2B|nr:MULTISPECIES: SDR family oxidoreductase [unclassified Novosphingobium]RQW42886.1 SDR family oxidoreductase [Novosphingobium sp. LASN5T]GAO54758.1 short-chain dehydrogenase/reductase SDR [Novosphingobium sp. MD-1]